MSIDKPTQARIASLIGENNVLLFMKGSREEPQCGFSAAVVKILDSLIPEYATFDVLFDADIREGIKTYSSWPTLPQLYVKGVFVGGCDIVRDLYASGELQEKLGIPAAVAGRVEHDRLDARG
jgi:monothiol glutaredoxin